MGFGRIRSVFESNEFEYHADIMFQIEAFRAYIKVTQDTIEGQIKGEIAKYKKIMEEEDEEYLAIGYDYSEMDILTHTSSLYYSSIFISISSFLERKMYKLCQIAESKTGVKIKSFKGKGIYKYHNYMTDVVGLNLSQINTQWQEIVKNWQFRNVLVHESEYPETEMDSNFTIKALDDYLLVVNHVLDHIVWERFH